jgi:hypothetical protein
VPPETSILSANDGSGTALTDGATTLAAAVVLWFDGADNGREPPPNGTTADATRLDEAQLAVDQHEGTSGSRCDQICADDGLAHARRRDEHTGVVTEQGPRGLFLDGCQPTLEGDLQRLAVTPLIFNAECAPVVLKDLRKLAPASAGQRHVLSQFLGTRNDARSQCRRQPKALLLVELGILESCQALDLIQMGR